MDSFGCRLMRISLITKRQQLGNVVCLWKFRPFTTKLLAAFLKVKTELRPSADPQPPSIKQRVPE